MDGFGVEYIKEAERRIKVEAEIKAQTGQPVMLNTNNNGAIEEVGYTCACNVGLKSKTLHRPLGIAAVACPICNRDTYIITVETFDN